MKTEEKKFFISKELFSIITGVEQNYVDSLFLNGESVVINNKLYIVDNILHNGIILITRDKLNRNLYL